MGVWGLRGIVMANLYRRGRKREYAACARLRNEGCSVIRSAGSHGPFDIVAFQPGGLIRLIQCKLDSSVVTKTDKTLLACFGEAFGCRAEVWHYHTRQSQPEIEVLNLPSKSSNKPAAVADKESVSSEPKQV